jgi:hypothetical protein
MLGYPAPIFPYDPPAILTVPLAFLVAWAVSSWAPKHLAEPEMISPSAV